MTGTGAAAGTGSAGQGASGGFTVGTGGTIVGTGGLISGVGGVPSSRGGSSGGTAAGGSGPIVGMISDLAVLPNPNSVLSAYVTWTTTVPATSVVQFGENGLSWQTEGEPNVTEHRVLVIGMRPETRYQIRAVSAVPEGTLEGSATHTTGSLPAHIPLGTVTVHDHERSQPGWTLMNVQKGDGTTSALSSAPPTAVAYDAEGYPVWYFVHGTGAERGGAISVDPTDRGVLLGPTLAPQDGASPFPPIEVDWAGETIWTCADPLCGVPDQLSHHAGKLSNGNYIVMRDASLGGVVSQVFLEFEAGNPVPIHEIGVEDGMMPPQNASGDWAHGNSIWIDLQNDAAYLSFRWLGLMKMTYSDKTLQWHLPARYGQDQLGLDFGDMEFEPPSSQFSDIHDPEIHADGTILFFDNGGFAFSFPIPEGNPQGLQTRALEYQIDEGSSPKKATLVWEWPGSFTVDPWYTNELYAPFWGDADRIQNGNVLITAGRRGTGANTPESTMIEVTKETGEVVWELKLPKDHGVYRAERIFPLPLLRKIDG